jgi:hypothetical protein
VGVEFGQSGILGCRTASRVRHPFRVWASQFSVKGVDFVEAGFR